jgi:predicted O-methyltransferase YrrM
MSLPERATFLYLLEQLPKRNIAIEIGTYCGGSLKWLSKYFNKVYSCDINHSHINKSQ